MEELLKSESEQQKALTSLLNHRMQKGCLKSRKMSHYNVQVETCGFAN